ncbi:MAG: SAM-dependent methyltransferase [Gammaproteobacteria bacterium]|nr:SAM-dependent methyltransferase [Gammaproteobacteria bacterium]
MHLLIFILIEIVLLPLQIIGVIIYTYRLRRISIPKKISGTANEPYGQRLLLHAAGTRRDSAAYRLAGHLPVYNKLVRFLIIDTVGLACGISGFKESLFSYPGPRPSSLRTFIVHRTAFFDNALRDALTRTENPIQQLVILGAGYDTRCYDLPEGIKVKCFEVDMAPTLNAKTQGLEAAGIRHDHVTFVETDFDQQTWMQALTEAGFASNLPTFVLWEGVTMYLSEEAVRDTLKLFANLPVGSEIAFDYFSRELIDAEPPYEKIGMRMMTQSIKYYEEKLAFGISTRKPAREQLELLVNDCGLTVAAFEHTQTEDPPTIPMYCFATAVKR